MPASDAACLDQRSRSPYSFEGGDVAVRVRVRVHVNANVNVHGEERGTIERNASRQSFALPAPGDCGRVSPASKPAG